MTDQASRPFGWLAPAIVLLAAIGVAISAYLTITRLTGGPIVCPVGGGGCDAVDASSYSTILGIPVAAFGLGYSAVVLGAGLAWWARGDRRALQVAYALGILGVLFEAYLVYLELFVIHAVCAWCVLYGVTVVLGLVAAALELRRTRPA